MILYLSRSKLASLLSQEEKQLSPRFFYMSLKHFSLEIAKCAETYIEKDSFNNSVIQNWVTLLNFGTGISKTYIKLLII